MIVFSVRHAAHRAARLADLAALMLANTARVAIPFVIGWSMACVAPSSLAQDSAALQQGTAFGKSIAPRSAKEVVNSTAVNGTAWSGSTGTPTAPP
ncbi:hypothetical protein, partial [Escherichia coli]|uniref:hypothetical protein n=1 Tax=Escherichia coli TaxID=562 RepID=UPI0019167DA6